MDLQNLKERKVEVVVLVLVVLVLLWGLYTMKKRKSVVKEETKENVVIGRGSLEQTKSGKKEAARQQANAQNVNKIVEHTFYFEGEGKVKHVLGNYTAYRKFLKQKESDDKKALKADKVIEAAKKEAAIVVEPEVKRKLTYKEKIEFEGLEKEMEKLTKENSDLTNKLMDPTSTAEDIKQMSLRMSEIANLLEIKENRWLELSELA